LRRAWPTVEPVATGARSRTETVAGPALTTPQVSARGSAREREIHVRREVDVLDHVSHVDHHDGARALLCPAPDLRARVAGARGGRAGRERPRRRTKVALQVRHVGGERPRGRGGMEGRRRPRRGGCGELLPRGAPLRRRAREAGPEGADVALLEG